MVNVFLEGKRRGKFATVRRFIHGNALYLKFFVFKTLLVITAAKA